MTSSIAYFLAASAGTCDGTLPRSASWRSVATVTDSASTWKWRRSACRVSLMPKPSVPSDVQSFGTQRLIRSGTARIQSLTATTGPSVPSSFSWMYGLRGWSLGWSRLCSSASIASRRSSVHEVTDQTSAPTPQSCASSCCAFSAHCMPVPDASNCAAGPVVSGAAAYL